MGLEQALRLGRADLRVIVAVDDAVEHEALVLGVLEGGLHGSDPGVLVRRRLGRGEDGDLAGAVGGDVTGHVGEALADAGRVGLVDEDVVGADGGAGVIADDLDSRGHRGLEGRRDSRRVVSRDHDGADTLRGRGLDEGDLLRGIRRARADLRHGAAQVRGRLLGAVEGGVEVRVVDLLGDDDHAEGGCRRRGRGCRRRRRRCRGSRRCRRRGDRRRGRGRRRGRAAGRRYERERGNARTKALDTMHHVTVSSVNCYARTSPGATEPAGGCRPRRARSPSDLV